MEASACGTPVIGGLSGGTDESIVDGETGYRVDQNDPAAIADAAIRLIKDRELAGRLGNSGRQRAVQDFDWEIQAKHLRVFLEDVTR